MAIELAKRGGFCQIDIPNQKDNSVLKKQNQDLLQKNFPLFQKFILHSRLEKHIEIRVIPHILYIFII